MELENFNTPRSNGTRITSETYSEAGMERIKRLLHNFSDAGEPKLYSVLVDGEMVVPKTENPDVFDTHRDFVNELTREVIVRLYFGSSPNCNTYKFSVAKPNTISGVSTPENQIAQALENQRKEMQILTLKGKVKRLKKKNLKLKQSLEENASVFNKKNMDGLKEYAGPIMGIIQSFRKPAEAASGMAGVENEAEVEIEPSIDPENLKMIEALEEQHGVEQTRGIIKFIIRLARHEDLIGQVSEALNEREAKRK